VGLHPARADVLVRAGHIKAQGEVGGNVTLADIAPTQAKLLDFNGFTAPMAPP
jgi:hypothetical protein